MSGMNVYEASWSQGWETGGDEFESFGVQEPELNVIEFLDSLEDVERVTCASSSVTSEKNYHHQSFQGDQYAFNAAVYELTINCLENGIKPTEKQLKKADALFPEKKQSRRTVHEGALGKWKAFAGNITVVEAEIDGIKRKGLTSKWDKSKRIIACREDWPFIVDRYHTDVQTGICLNLRATIQSISQVYVAGNKRHGIPEAFIKARVSQCTKCDEQLEDSQPSKRLRKGFPERWPEVHTIPWQQLDNFIESLCIRHRVSLRKESTYRIGSPEPSIVTTWVCARGFRKRGAVGHNCSENSTCSYRVRTIIPARIAELSPGFTDTVVEMTDTNQLGKHSEIHQVMDSVQLADFQELTSHESFFEQPQQVNAVQYLDNNTILVTVLLNRAHRGHNPNDKEDYINFPVHQSAKEAVMYEFDLSWDTIAVSRASLRMDMLLKSKATELDKATTRFHLLPKEVAQLTIELNSQGKLSSSDWTRLLKEVDAHRKKGTVIFFQQYDVFNPVEEKQPFVCVIMTPWMKAMAERFSTNSVWALDSTFKTCVRGLPLYAAAVPNQDGIGMPVFFMICSADTGSRHQATALKLAMSAVFKHLNVRPAAILMDKSRLSYDALSEVISRDEKCWRDGKQVACRVLLCWFCVKKFWIETLLPQVPPERRKDVFRRLDAMLMAGSEKDFNNLWDKFKEQYGTCKEVIDYMELGWAGSHCIWRPTWPTYGRLFEHGSIETLNIVRYFWLFLKYSVFQGQVNQSNCELLVALIGSALTNDKTDGCTLEAFYRERQAVCDSRRYHSQASSSAERKRLAFADRFLAHYSEDKSCFQVLSEPGFLFKLHHCVGDHPKAHVVNLLTNFCDCLETRFTCEHLLAARLIIKHNYVGMYGLLERRIKEGDEPLTHVEDIDLAWLDDKDGSDDRAMGLTPPAGNVFSEWDSFVQEITHVQMQLSNLQACCEDQLIGSPVVEELSALLCSQLKSLRAFTGGTEQDGGSKGGAANGSQVGIIQEHLKACKLQAVKCPVQLKTLNSTSGFSSVASSSSDKTPSYAHAQTVIHPKLGYVHYYKQLKPVKVSRRKCIFCGVYNIVGVSFEVTECKNCSRYLFYELHPTNSNTFRL